MDKKLKLEDLIPQYISKYDNQAKHILNRIKDYYMGYVVYDLTKLDIDSFTTFNILIALKNNIWETEERSLYGCIIYVTDEILEKFCTNIPDFFDKLDVRYKNRTDTAADNN